MCCWGVVGLCVLLGGGRPVCAVGGWGGGGW